MRELLLVLHRVAWYIVKCDDACWDVLLTCTRAKPGGRWKGSEVRVLT